MAIPEPLNSESEYDAEYFNFTGEVDTSENLIVFFDLLIIIGSLFYTTKLVTNLGVRESASPS